VTIRQGRRCDPGRQQPDQQPLYVSRRAAARDRDIFDHSPGLQRLRLLEGLLRVASPSTSPTACRCGRIDPGCQSPDRLGPSERTLQKQISLRECGLDSSMIGIAALAVGMVLGLIFTQRAEVIQPYLPIAVVAALEDAVFGGLRAYLERSSTQGVVVSFVFNVFVAALIVYVGDQLGVGTQLSRNHRVLGIRSSATPLGCGAGYSGHDARRRRCKSRSDEEERRMSAPGDDAERSDEGRSGRHRTQREV